ncbi:hypothetical protein ACQRAW_02170 [Fusicatenibacter saccharivorans]|uniref:hypothetical protein n=1 Tax=Fusicatenibacter saccharivorans TaxID=1150298 RepID=UPI003D00A87D
MIRKTNLSIGLMLCLIKAFYIINIVLMLPETYAIWDFEKNIVLWNLVYEIIPFLVGLIILLCSINDNSVLSTASIGFFILYFIPANSGMCLSNNDPGYYYLHNIFCILCLWLFGRNIKNEKRNCHNDNFNIELVFENRKQIGIIRAWMIVFCFLCIIYVYLCNGLNFNIFFSEMYTVRADFADSVAQNTGTIFAYLVLIIRGTSGLFLTIYLYIAIIAKKPLDILICLFSFIALFTVSMEKSTLMLILMVVFFAYLEISGRTNKLCRSLVFAILALFVLPIIEYYIRGESLVFTMLIRRVFYIPQYMMHIHYDFFKTAEKFWFRQDAFLIQNILQLLFNKPYPYDATAIISQNCFNGLIPAPNSGGFAEAYSQMGALGTFVFPFIYSKLFVIMSKWASWYGEGAGRIIMLKLILSLISVHFLASSSLVGFVLFIGITYVIRNIYHSKSLS